MGRWTKAAVAVAGRWVSAGTAEQDVPRDIRGLIGEHIWTDANPEDLIQPEHGAVLSQLHETIANRDAENSELRKQVETLQRQLEEATLTAKGESSTEEGAKAAADETGAELTESKLKQLKKEELLSLAEERGVEIPEGATNAEITAALLA